MSAKPKAAIGRLTSEPLHRAMIRKYNRCEGCGLADLASLDDASFVTCPDSTTGWFLKTALSAQRQVIEPFAMVAPSGVFQGG